MTATHLALDHRFGIAGNAPGRQLLGRIIYSLESRSSEPAASVYHLHIHTDRTDQATIGRDGFDGFVGPVGTAVSRLLTEINVSAIASVPAPVVHAAVVAGPDGTLAGRSIVIPGNPGAGKSTLCAALVAAGYHYLSDEAAPIDPVGAVRPYPKPIVVSEGSFDVLRDLHSGDLANGSLDAWFLDPMTLGGGVAQHSATVGAVVHAQYAAGAACSVDTLTAGEVTALLASNTFHLRDHGRPVLEQLAGLSHGVLGARLIYGDLADAVHAVNALVGR